MSKIFEFTPELPHEQRLIQAKCVHPSGAFVPFSNEDVEQSIPRRFEKMVEMHASRTAVKTREHVFSYGALNEAANRVAHAVLFQQGEGAEPIVLLLEHGAPLVTAMLGVLKAGKFYVPLDPSHPHARNRYIVNNAQSRLIVTNTRNLALANELVPNGCRLLNLDTLDGSLPTENPRVSAGPDTFACCLYTSGSTGQPKGVIQNHRNGLHDIRLWTESFHICPEDRLTLFAFGTGQALKNIYSAVLNGAALYPRDIKEEGLGDLAAWLIEEEITMYFSGAPLFRYFLDALNGEQSFPKLRLIRLGSDKVIERDVERYKRQFSPDCILVVALSSNEVGTFRQQFIDSETCIGHTVPVGYGVDDKKVLLLDDAGQEVSGEGIGEITVVSRYLSPGYWRQPDLTQSAFQPDPRGGSARVYRTGDLGRMLPNGCLEHLGRKDLQIKIRGYRVGTAEVEAALLALEAVKEAVVIGWEDGDDEFSTGKRLVAYIVPQHKPVPSVTELRGCLLDTLPDYMIPSNFIFLDSLPLAPSGKIDRRALPRPDEQRPLLSTPFVEPGNPSEAKIAKIWSELLNVEQVGIYDNFFELGGHSLSVTRLISTIRRLWNLELRPRNVFEVPTVAGLAALIDALIWAKSTADRSTGESSDDEVGSL